MVTTRSQGPAHATEALPLRSRVVVQHGSSSPALNRTRRLAGQDHHHRAPTANSSKPSSTESAGDEDQTRSALADTDQHQAERALQDDTATSHPRPDSSMDVEPASPQIESEGASPAHPRRAPAPGRHLPDFHALPLMQTSYHHRQPARWPAVKDRHHVPAHRPRSSLARYKSATTARGRRTSRWPGQKSSFLQGR